MCLENSTRGLTRGDLGGDLKNILKAGKEYETATTQPPHFSQGQCLGLYSTRLYVLVVQAWVQVLGGSRAAPNYRLPRYVHRTRPLKVRIFTTQNCRADTYRMAFPVVGMNDGTCSQKYAHSGRSGDPAQWRQLKSDVRILELGTDFLWRPLTKPDQEAPKPLLFLTRPSPPRGGPHRYVPSSVTATSSTDFETIFGAALEAYKTQTKKDIALHPLATQLQSCDSPSAILAVLRAQIQAFDETQNADEKLTKWLDPTVNVLYAFAATLGNGVGLIFPLSNAVFAGIGILLQAVKDVRASQDALRFEAYIEVRPTAAMTDVIMKIMVEVLSILTKEIGQGRMSISFQEKYLKELVGKKDVKDALERLDKLTQEGAHMAAIEVWKIGRGIDDKVKDIDAKAEHIVERVQVIHVKVEEVDEKVQSVDSKVQGVDHKVGSVIEGGLCLPSPPPDSVLTHFVG
ncbi:hypothetical protein EDB92DRAFT_1812109 [Lactarius akahatsu]|uniref:Fungal STAND N-terminal Goodbye domain-containing protein n=1 Tax=Lactarius akahatsu TaxID=416441 RepID=A0AAD4LRG8_9AGAM|nr:hypothetical protein EDB92DRAFT_1812109 [Lactarius akahatsu]